MTQRQAMTSTVWRSCFPNSIRLQRQALQRCFDRVWQLHKPDHASHNSNSDPERRLSKGHPDDMLHDV